MRSFVYRATYVNFSIAVPRTQRINSRAPSSLMPLSATLRKRTNKTDRPFRGLFDFSLFHDSKRRTEVTEGFRSLVERRRLLLRLRRQFCSC